MLDHIYSNLALHSQFTHRLQIILLANRGTNRSCLANYATNLPVVHW